MPKYSQDTQSTLNISWSTPYLQYIHYAQKYSQYTPKYSQYILKYSLYTPKYYQKQYMPKHSLHTPMSFQHIEHNPTYSQYALKYSQYAPITANILQSTLYVQVHSTSLCQSTYMLWIFYHNKSSFRYVERNMVGVFCDILENIALESILVYIRSFF